MTKGNKYFVYEGEILRAAQSSFSGAFRYFSKGRTIYKGDPENTKIKCLTVICNKLKFYGNENN